MRKRVRLTFGKVPERALHSDVTERCKFSTGESGDFATYLWSAPSRTPYLFLTEVLYLCDTHCPSYLLRPSLFFP